MALIELFTVDTGEMTTMSLELLKLREPWILVARPDVVPCLPPLLLLPPPPAFPFSLSFNLRPCLSEVIAAALVVVLLVEAAVAIEVLEEETLETLL